MKNLMITLVAALALVPMSFAQSACINCNSSESVCVHTVALAPQSTTTTNRSGDFSAQSQAIDFTGTSLNLLYLRDGYDNYAAFTLPLFDLGNTNGRLKLNAFGAFDPANIERQAYVGTGLSFDIVDEKGWKLTAFGGLKGLNLSDNFRLQDGNRSFVYGFGVSIPFSSK